MWYRTTNAYAHVFSQDSPTVGPSKNPSRSPSKAPTDNPSKSPTQSPTPDDCVRTVVYQCREFPYEGWCKQTEPQECIDPDTCGWKAVGFCRGTRSPTASPTRYTGTCRYDKCVDVEGTETSTVSTCNGVSDCTCTGSGETEVCTKTTKTINTVCTPTDVNNYSSSATYDAHDVVRVGRKRFKCKDFPYSGWCSSGVLYAPLTGPHWTRAWDEDGICTPDPTSSPSESPTSDPTVSPNKSPTSNPTVSPTSNPTLSPSKNPTLAVSS
jgi:hypothetical protein